MDSGLLRGGSRLLAGRAHSELELRELVPFAAIYSDEIEVGRRWDETTRYAIPQLRWPGDRIQCQASRLGPQAQF